MKNPSVGIIMGSQSDWVTMREAAVLLDELGDSLYSILQMPRGFPVATMAIGAAGAANAALMAVGILALQDDGLAKRLDDWRAALSASIKEEPTDD